jgi:hypothetical protein
MLLVRKPSKKSVNYALSALLSTPDAKIQPAGEKDPALLIIITS